MFVMKVDDPQLQVWQSARAIQLNLLFLSAYRCYVKYHHSKITSHLSTHAHLTPKPLAHQVWSLIEPDLAAIR